MHKNTNLTPKQRPRGQNSEVFRVRIKKMIQQFKVYAGVNYNKNHHYAALSLALPLKKEDK